MKHYGTISLSGKRIKLRRIRESDAVAIYNSFINQEEYLYYANKKRRSLEEQKISLIGIDKKYEKLDYYNWVITLNEVIIGSINCHINSDNGMINYALDNRYVNNGYMTEALGLVLDYLLNYVKLNKVECGCVVENIKSKKVIEKNNMKYYGILKSEVLLEDGFHDMYLYYLERG